MPIASDVSLAADVQIFHPDLVNLYGCTIGSETKIGAFVEIQKNASVGARCKISSHTFICEGVTIEDEVFVGHGVMFTNDLYPRAVNDEGTLQTEADWSVIETRVKRRASIGSNACDFGRRNDRRAGAGWRWRGGDQRCCRLRHRGRSAGTSNRRRT